MECASCKPDRARGEDGLLGGWCHSPDNTQDRKGVVAERFIDIECDSGSCKGFMYRNTTTRGANVA